MADSFTSEYLKRRKERTAQSALSSMATRDYAQSQLASAARSVSTSQTAKIPAQPSSSPSTSRHSAKSAFTPSAQKADDIGRQPGVARAAGSPTMTSRSRGLVSGTTQPPPQPTASSNPRAQALPFTPGAYAHSDEAPKNGFQRLNLGVSGILQGITATPGVLYETGKQQAENTRMYREDPEVQDLQKQLSQLSGQLDYIARYKYPTRREAEASAEYQDILGQMRDITDRMSVRRVNAPVDMESEAMQRYFQAKSTQEKALDGLTGAPRWLGEQAISIGQNAAVLPLSLVSPALSLGAMGSISAADRMYELSAQGKSADEALTRGLVSGAIEAATEKIPLDNLMDLVRTGGKSALKNLLKQAGVEAGEESLSYVMNYIADKAARDPDAEFSLSELANSAAGGAFSGLVFGGLGTAINRMGSTQAAQERTASPRTAPDVEANGPQRGTEVGESGFHAPSAVRDVDLKRAFGENGAQAYRLGWRGDMDEADYYRAFAHAYNAGAAGRSLDSLKDRTLTDAQRGAAFESGRSDADAAARKAGFTTVYGKDSGLVWDDYTKSMDQKVAGQVNEVAQRLGVKVQFADQVAGGAANAEIENGVITIARDAKNPVRAVFGHEITHRIQELAPEEYRTFREVAMAGMEYLDQNVEAIRELYAKGDQELSNLEAMDEIAADYAGSLMEDGALLDRFIRTNQGKPTLLEKLRDVFRSLADRLTGKYKSQARQAERRLEQALKAAESRAEAMQGQKNTAQEGGEAKHSFKGYDEKTGRGIYESNFPLGTPRKAKAERILSLVQNVWSKMPIDLVIEEDGKKRNIQAQFDPTYDPSGNTPSDVTKLMGGNRHGTASERRVTLDLADDYYQIASEATYNYSKEETGKSSAPHENVRQWHYFINDILFQEHGKTEMEPYRVSVNVKERSDGQFVYSFSAERQNERLSTRRTLHADVNQTAESGEANAQPDRSIPQPGEKSNEKFSLKGTRDMLDAVKELMERADREAGWTEAEFRREVDQIAKRIYGSQVEQAKEQAKARDKAGQQRRSAADLRRKIARHTADLSKKLLKPSDKRHIPESLRGPVAAMLEAINLESAYTVDENGRRTKDPSGSPVKRTEAFRALRAQYEAIAGGVIDFDGVLDPDLLDHLGKVTEMADIPLYDMSVEQLETVWQTVKAVEHSITSANRLMGEARAKGVAELAWGIRSSTAHKRVKANYGGNAVGSVRDFGDRLLNLDMLDPLTFLHTLGEGGDELYHELQQARDQKTSILAETVRQTQDAVGETDVRKIQEESHSFTTAGGEEIKLTTAQLMSLYELTKRKQAQDHIYKGGLRTTAVTGSRAGKLDAPPAGIKVTQEDVAAMVNSLTNEQVKLADALQGIMQDYLAEQGNEASLKVYGYRKFTEDHYFPITSDPHQVQTKIGDVLEGGQKRPVSVAEWGSAKNTQQGANNGILLGDIFDVVAQHAVDMSTYASHLGVMEDMNRVRNYKFRNGEGIVIGTMKDIIQQVTGQGGNAYLDKLLQDVSAGTAKSGVTGLSKLTANYKAASVALNMRVIVQQPTAYLRAGAVINPKYLTQALVTKRDGWSTAKKWAPIAVWKDWGNFEINQGRQIQDLMFNTDKTMDKLKNAGMAGAGAADSLAWGRLWVACELETQDTRPDLERGSDAFYRAVAQRFTDVVDQTQVVDNVLGRSQLMRSGDQLSKMATSYMGEPTKSYNMLYRSYRDWSQEQDPGRRTAARKRMGRALTAFTASAFLNAVAQSLWDAVRDDEDRDRKYLERLASHILPNLADNLNPLGMVPYLKDVWSVVQGYDVKRMDLAAITSLIQAGQALNKALNGEGRYTVHGSLINLLAETGRVFGLPTATVKRDMIAIARTVLVEAGDWEGQYRLEKRFSSVGATASRSGFYDILFSALKEGDLDAYQSIAQDMATGGVKSATIESAMRSRYDEAVRADPDFSMPQRARDLIGSRDTYETEKKPEAFTAKDLSPQAYNAYASQKAETYRGYEDALTGLRSFQGLTNEEKNTVLNMASSLADKAALADASGGQYEVTAEWMRWATGGGKFGVDETEAILFKMAYDMAQNEREKERRQSRDGKNRDSMEKDTMEIADKLLPNLTRKEEQYLKSLYWDYKDKYGWKKD